MKAVIAGAGIGGLAAAVALHRRGVEVTVVERSQHPNAGGAALSLWPNALRALDRLGVGAEVRRHAALGGTSGIRRPDGRWIARSDLGAAIEVRYGDPLVLVHRVTLTRLLTDQLPAEVVRYGFTVTGADPGTRTSAAVLHGTGGDLSADLIVAADGIRSVLREAMVRPAPTPRYAGYTAWRMIVEDPGGTEPAETWGPDGQRFAILPLGGGQCYCYATAKVAAKTAYGDDAEELRRRFADWHAPIGAILDRLSGADVVRNDIEELPPLPTMHLGRVALLGDAAHAMTPDLGQGACQAIEDAVVLATTLDPDNPETVSQALTGYTEQRLPRTVEIVRRSRKAGSLYDRPLAVRRVAARLMNLIPPSAIARSLAPVVDWRPPAAAAD